MALALSSAPASLLRQLRQRWGPTLNRIVSTFGQPVTNVYPAGYVGTLHKPIEDVETELRDSGFSWDPVSLYHRTPEGDAADGSWAYRSSWLADRQLHVVLFVEGPDETDVYAHDEFNWSRHPIKHAREIDIQRNEGRAEMQRWLESQGQSYETDSVSRRKIRHTVTHLRERLNKRISR